MPLSDSSREPSLEYAFHPRSMAVIGLSPDPHGTWLNRMYLQAPLEAGFKGPIYPVNRKGGHIGHIRVYTSLSEVPEPPDYVVSCIPAQQTPDLLEECRAVGVKVLQLYTAGFTETGLSSGIKLQDRLLEIARRARIRLIGPNCMGVYCPDWGMSFSPDLPKEPGNIGFLCQSGGNAVFLIRSAAARGLRFSKGISYGNACDVNECDILEYLADDRGTKVIAAYIEGTSDGRRFADVLSRAAAVKPVVVYKGGYTEAGGRAAASHTGAMAGSEVIWDGIIRQTGAIRVNSIEEMIDMLVALVQMKRPKGLNTCVVGIGGGASVVATDEMEKAGLRLPPIPPSIQERMAQIIPPAGGMLRNPIDAFPLSRLILYKKRAQGGKSGNAHAGDKGWSDFMSLLENWPDIDAVIFHFPFDTPPVPASNWAAATVEPVLTAVRTCHLPSAVVFHSIVTDASWRESRKMQAICLAEEIPFFLSLKGAAESIAHLHQAGQIAKIWSVEKQH